MVDTEVTVITAVSTGLTAFVTVTGAGVTLRKAVEVTVHVSVRVTGQNPPPPPAPGCIMIPFYLCYYSIVL